MVSDIYIKDEDAEYADEGKVGYSDGSVRNIYLQSTAINYAVGVFTQVSQQPGKTNSQDHNTLLAYGDFLGFDNPKLTISGVIDLQTFDQTTGADPTITSGDLPITLRLLQQIFISGHVFTLYDYYNADSTIPIYRMSGLTGTFPAETVTTMKVRCTGVSAKSFIKSDVGGARIDYVLQLVEVRG